MGLVGSPPVAQKEAYNSGDGEDSLLESTGLIDLRGKTSLVQLAGACRQAKAVISVDMDRSISPLLLVRQPMRLLVTTLMVWGPVRCVYGCRVAATSLVVSAYFLLTKL